MNPPNGTPPSVLESQRLSEELKPVIARLERVIDELERIAQAEDEECDEPPHP
jgi:hypothetical protein